jgi:tetratricopeptide (TPR) repeat protein
MSYMGTGQFNIIANIIPGVIDLLEKKEMESDFFANPVNPYSTQCAYCGVSMGYLGNFEEGQMFLEKGLRHAAQIGDLRTLAIVENCWGWFFHTKGNWKYAIEHFQNCIKYGEEVKFLAILAWSWALLGHVYSFLGDPETGKRYVEKGLKIQRDAGFEWFLSFHPYFLGDICLKSGDLKNARRFTDEALRLSPKNNEKLVEGRSWILLGRILGRTETSQIDKAEEYILQGMKILDELKLKPDYAKGYFDLGELYANAGQKEKALENLKRAESMFQDMGMDYWLTRTRELLKGIGL